MTVPPLAARDRLLDLLDKAYEVSADPASLDDLLASAARYFLADAGSVAADIPRAMADDPYLRPHINRIAQKLEALEAVPESHGSPYLPSYARMVLAKGGVVLTANSAATALTGLTAPAPVSMLPFDGETMRAIDKALRGLGGRVSGHSDRVMLNITCEPDGSACVGLLARTRLETQSGQSADVLTLSLSHIDWSAKQDVFSEPPFNLTRSESEVLASLMDGLSYNEIAQARGRLVSTVRSQVKAIMRKTGRNKVGGLVQLGASVGYLTELSNAIGETRQDDGPDGSNVTEPRPAPAVNRALLNQPLTLVRADGRSLGYHLHGPQDGRPVLFFHGLIMGPTITPAIEIALRRYNLRLIAPSRPHFGSTTPPPQTSGFDTAVVDDVAALLDHLKLEDFIILAHQGGVSHAFRAAGRFANRLHGMVMISAGIPIDESRHLRSMNTQTRLAAAATRHAPMLMELLTRAAIAVYTRRGLEHFLFDHFAENPDQLASFRDPDVLSVFVEGLRHMIAQGPKAFVADGGAAMANWSEDFSRVTSPCSWLHGKDDPVLKPDDIADWIATRGNHTLNVIEGGTASLLYTDADRILSEVSSRFRQSPG